MSDDGFYKDRHMSHFIILAKFNKLIYASRPPPAMTAHSSQHDIAR